MGYHVVVARSAIYTEMRKSRSGKGEVVANFLASAVSDVGSVTMKKLR
jgi:hypothetical protein